MSRAGNLTSGSSFGRKNIANTDAGSTAPVIVAVVFAPMLTDSEICGSRGISATPGNGWPDSTGDSINAKEIATG